MNPEVDYTHTGGFDRDKFMQASLAVKSKNAWMRARYNAASTQNAWVLIEMMQADSRVIDLRWMAYMLATALWEGSEVVVRVVQEMALGKGRKPILGADKKPVMIERTRKVWNSMVPIDELKPADHLRYKAPVKVKRINAQDADLLRAMSKKLDDAGVFGGAWIVEKDGDQFVVASDGRSVWQSRAAAMGAAYSGAASPVYTDFHGDAWTYTGRGYVQLTWWCNYVAAGIALQRGLDLLFSPLLVKEPQVAYGVMAHGMLTGKGFANGRKLSDFIQGTNKDYESARLMVNPNERQSFKPVAEIAQIFEDLLVSAKVSP